MNLEEWRKSNGWSQQHLANVLSKKLNQTITQDYISRLENGQHPLYNIGSMIKKLSRDKVTFERVDL